MGRRWHLVSSKMADWVMGPCPRTVCVWLSSPMKDGKYEAKSAFLCFSLSFQMGFHRLRVTLGMLRQDGQATISGNGLLVMPSLGIMKFRVFRIEHQSSEKLRQLVWKSERRVIKNYRIKQECDSQVTSITQRHALNPFGILLFYTWDSCMNFFEAGDATISKGRYFLVVS